MCDKFHICTRIELSAICSTYLVPDEVRYVIAVVLKMIQFLDRFRFFFSRYFRKVSRGKTEQAHYTHARVSRRVYVYQYTTYISIPCSIIISNENKILVANYSRPKVVAYLKHTRSHIHTYIKTYRQRKIPVNQYTILVPTLCTYAGVYALAPYAANSVPLFAVSAI